MSPSSQLDGGSDLSELSDAGSQPGTPGQAITPQTSPVPQTRRASLRSRGNDESNPTTLTIKNSGSAEDLEENLQRPLRSRKSQGELSQMKGKAAAGNDTQQQTNAKSNKKAPTQQKWEYKEMLDKNIFQEDPLIEGKRARKSVDRYGNDGIGAEGKQPSLRRRSSSSRKSVSHEPADETSTTRQARNAAIKSPSTSVIGPEHAEDQPQQSVSKKIKIKRKPKAEVSHLKTEHDTAQEESEEEQPTRKRRKGSTYDKDGSNLNSEEFQKVTREREKGIDEDEDDDLPHPRKNKIEERKKIIKLKKLKHDKKKDSEPISDEYEEEHITDSDVAMSDDADEDAFDGSRDEGKISIEEKAFSERRKPKVKPIQRTSSNPKPNKARPSSSNIVPAKDLAASIPQSQETNSAKSISTGQSNLAPSSVKSIKPQRPPVPPKNVIRKSVGSSVLDNLMGFGTPSRSGPPRPRPTPPSATSSPQPQQAKRPGEPIRPRPSMNDPSSRVKENDKSTTHDSSNLGLVGKHITQEQMAAKREKEVEQYANPKDLFNLLEGTELMMEFEDETRQRLQIDPFLHKHKLYRPGRTEGMWKLIERIKETEGLSQAAV